LYKAVAAFSDQLFVKNDIQFNLVSNLEGKRFNSDIEIGLYRVVCELLNNGVKHSHAKRINLSVNKDGNFLEIKYRDNGVGFNPESPEIESKGMGIENMKSRVRFLKGSLFIDSVSKKFTTIKILIPIK